MDFGNNRSFAASDDLDAVSESLSELLDRIDDMLIWIEQRGSNTELVYCPKNTREIVSRLYFKMCIRDSLGLPFAVCRVWKFPEQQGQS